MCCTTRLARFRLNMRDPEGGLGEDASSLKRPSSSLTLAPLACPRSVPGVYLTCPLVCHAPV
jgi:hypothetical protein